jgi:ribokinase
MSHPERQGRVCVVGSLNLDYVTTVPAFPAPGQTLAASDFVLRYGGKGANQAYAAARQGATVTLIGALGDDAAGQDYRARLSQAGISDAGVRTVPGPSGAAFIQIIPSGENTIVVASGANGEVTAADVERSRHAIEEAAVLLVGWEVPTCAVVTAIQIANRSGTQVIFNPSPFQAGFPWEEVTIDVLVMNEGEAERLDEATPAGVELPIESLVITYGAAPTELITPDGDREFPPPKVTAIDTVGAGDAFAGTLAARLAFGDSLEAAVPFANAAGALATTKLGAQEAMPNAAEVSALLEIA